MFWRRAAADMTAARRRLYVQAMTFEADDAGSQVGRGIMESPAADRRVLVDHYTRFVISDRFVRSPRLLFDQPLRHEIMRTYAMFKTLKQNGAGVRLTNPMGPLLLGFPFRNHKKLIVADDVAYIGGINFSDHNFEWHDLMLRIEGAAVADALAADFEATWGGRAGSWTAQFGDMRLYSFDGEHNAEGFDEIIARIDAAASAITVISPYLTFPFVEALQRARGRGVAVSLITPLANNKRTVRDYLVDAARRADLDLRFTPEMIHMKAMLLDGRELILGSSNFDFVSYRAEEELVAVIANPGLIADFRLQVLDPLNARTLPAEACAVTPRAAARSRAVLKAADWLIRHAPQPRRTTTEWVW